MGDEGADRLAGDVGWDTLTGGLGADIFAMEIDTAVAGEFDRITNLQDGADLIAIAGLSTVDSLTWQDGSNGLEVFVNGNQVFQINGSSSNIISAADFVT